MEQKHVKNERMSTLYKRLSIEDELKPSVHYTMNYSVVDQIRYVSQLLGFLVLSAI